jgi:hypothetical protein
MIGARIGAYEIIDRLGAGGMGEVYRARDTKLGRDVATKILPPQFASDPDRRMPFSRQAPSGAGGADIGGAAQQAIEGALAQGGRTSGAMLGVVRGATSLTGPSAFTVSATADGLVRATADVKGNVAAIAKAAIEGAIAGAEEAGINVAAAASAAATGALKAGSTISAPALEEVKRAMTSTIFGTRVVVKAPSA